MYWPITHMVAPSDDALNCEECHAKEGRLANLAGFYMPGRDAMGLGGMLGLLILAAAVLGVAGHAAIRLFTRGKGGSHE